jgi:hypothetical protein
MLQNGHGVVLVSVLRAYIGIWSQSERATRLHNGMSNNENDLKKHEIYNELIRG